MDTLDLEHMQAKIFHHYHRLHINFDKLQKIQRKEEDFEKRINYLLRGCYYSSEIDKCPFLECRQ